MFVLFIITMGLTLWSPSSGPSAASAEGKQHIDARAALLAASPADARAIDVRIRSLSSFPLDAKASRALADGLSACETATLDDAHRRRFAGELYAITTPTDDSPRLLPGALEAVQALLMTARCSRMAVDTVLSAARTVARREPHPRRDWR